MTKTILIFDSGSADYSTLIGSADKELEALHVQNGQEASDFLRRKYKSVAAILLVIYKPCDYGFEFLKNIRAQARFARIPILVMSDADSLTHEINAFSLGANDFVALSCSHELLRLRLLNLIKLSAAGAENTSKKPVESDKADIAEQLKAIIDNAGSGITAAVFDGHIAQIIMSNSKYYETFGYTKEQYDKVFNASFGPVISLDRERLLRAVRDAMCTEQPFTIEYRAERRDGKEIWLRHRITCTHFAGIDGVVYLGVLDDITAQKTAEEKIRTLNENLWNMMNDTPGGYVRIKVTEDGTGAPDYVNESFCRLLGMAQSEIIEKYSDNITSQVHPDDIKTVMGAIKAAFSQGGRTRAKYRLLHKNGEYVWLQMFGRLTENEMGEYFLNAYFTDISEQERKEITFRETMPCLLEAIMKSSEELAFSKDRNFKYICCSKTFALFAGKSCESDIIGKDDYEIFAPEIADRFRRDDIRLFNCDESLVNYTEALRLGNDDTKYVSISKYILRDTFGTAIGLYGVARDITENLYSDSKLRLLADSIPGGIATYVCTPNNKITLSYFNDGFCKLLGCTRAKYDHLCAEKGSCMSLVFDEDIHIIYEQLERLRKYDIPVNCTYRVHSLSGDGLKWINLRGIVFERNRDTYIVNAVLYDVTEMKLTEEKMKAAQEELLRSNRLVDDSSSAVYVCDTETYKMLYVNKTCAQICGRTVAEAEDMTCYAYLKGLSKPCSQCYINTSAYDCFTCREYSSEVTGKHYMMRGKLIDWNGRRALVEYMSDTTESINTRLSLMAGQSAMRIASSNSGISFWQFDIDKRIITWNSNKCKSTLNDIKETLNVPDSMIDANEVHPDDIGEFERVYNEIFCDAESAEATVRLLNQNTGKYVWQHIVYTRLHDSFYKTRQAVGFAADVDLQQETKLRYEHEKQLRKELIKNAVIYYELNLTASTVTEYRTLLNEDIGMTSGLTLNDDICKAILGKVVMPDRRAVQNTIFSTALLEAHNNGKTSVELEYRRMIPGKGIHWIKATALLMKHPVTGDAVAFIYLHDINNEKISKLALESVMYEEIDSVFVINTRNGMARLINSRVDSKDFGVMLDFKYNEIMLRDVIKYVTDDDKEKCIEFFRLSSLKKHLNEQTIASITFTIHDSEKHLRHKRLTAYFLDETREYIVLSRRDITGLYAEEQRQKLQLQRAVDSANDANQAKSEFLSRMSHDIRTPMNAIIGLVNLAKEEDNPPETIKYLDNIDSSSHFLLGLINDVLDLSRIESGKVSLNETAFSMDEFASSIQIVIQPLVDTKSIAFKFDIGDIPPHIVADKLRFSQIFFNLLSNAVKYTPNGGNVEFLAEHIDNRDGKCGMRFHIRDSGIGMSEEFQKIAFDPFSQENIRSKTETTGTGLGLAIVKNLVEIMGGTITLNSALGKGSEFIVDLYAREADESEVNGNRRVTDHTSLRGLSVLLVEDNDMNILVAEKLLQHAGCIVSVAKNGLEAVRKFEESECGYFGVILMDVRMPVMDGIEATQKIRALNRKDASDVPIIAMTGDVFIDDKKKTAKSGMNAHVSKPIEPLVLYDTIVKAIARQ